MLFSNINIPQAVYDEIVVAGREKDVAIREVSTSSWVKTVAVRDRLAVEVLLDELDAGEAETIVLAREPANWVAKMEARRSHRVAGLTCSFASVYGLDQGYSSQTHCCVGKNE